MIITAYRQQLLRLAQQAARAAPANDLIPEIAGILVEADKADGSVTMMATNQETTIKAIGFADVEEGGSFLIDHKLFPAMLSKLSQDEVRIETTNGDHRFHIESGDAEYNYNVLPGSIFPKEEIPCPEGALVIKGVRELVGKTAFAASTDSKALHKLRCIYLSFTPQGLFAAASNGRQMIQVAGDRDCKGELSIMVPAEAMLRLAQLVEPDEELHVQLAGRHVVFWHETLIFSTRLVEGDYLPVDAVFKGVEKKYTVKTTAEEFLACVASVVDPQSHQLEVLLGENCVEVTCTLNVPSPDKPASKEVQQAYALGRSFSGTNSLRAIITGSPGKPFYCEPRLLMNGLRALSGTILIGYSEQGHMLIRDANSRYYQTGLKGAKSAAGKAALAAAA